MTLNDETCCFPKLFINFKGKLISEAKSSLTPFFSLPPHAYHPLFMHSCLINVSIKTHVNKVNYLLWS